MYRDFAEALKIAEEQKYISAAEGAELFKYFVESNKKK